MGGRVNGRARAILGLFAGGLTVFAGATAVAEGPEGAPAGGVDLLLERRVGAERCPDDSALREAIATRIGRDPFAPTGDAGPAGGPPRPLVLVTLERLGPRIRARVDLQSAAGTLVSRRELSEVAARCDELVLAVAVSLGVAFDLDSASRLAETPIRDSSASANRIVMVSAQGAQAPQETTFAVTSTAVRGGGAEARARETATPTERDERMRPRLRALASGAVQVGGQPDPALALLAGVGVRLGWASVLADLRLATGARVDTSSGAGASTAWAGAALTPCAHVDRWGLCLVGEVARLEGRGFGVEVPREDEIWLVSAGLAGIGEWWLTRSVGLHARAELAMPVVSADLTIDERTLWRTPAWKLMAGLGVTFESR